MVKFKKYESNDFVRCERCKAALHFDEFIRAWICKPECKEPTVLKAEMRLVIVDTRKGDAGAE